VLCQAQGSQHQHERKAKTSHPEGFRLSDDRSGSESSASRWDNRING
jgi:hypothetical protein